MIVFLEYHLNVFYIMGNVKKVRIEKILRDKNDFENCVYGFQVYFMSVFDDFFLEYHLNVFISWVTLKR